MTNLQQTIIEELKVKPSIDPQEEIRMSIDFMKSYLTKHPFLKRFSSWDFRRTRFYTYRETCANGSE